MIEQRQDGLILPMHKYTRKWESVWGRNGASSWHNDFTFYRVISYPFIKHSVFIWIIYHPFLLTALGRNSSRRFCPHNLLQSSGYSTRAQETQNRTCTILLLKPTVLVLDRQFYRGTAENTSTQHRRKHDTLIQRNNQPCNGTSSIWWEQTLGATFVSRFTRDFQPESTSKGDGRWTTRLRLIREPVNETVILAATSLISCCKANEMMIFESFSEVLEQLNSHASKEIKSASEISALTNYLSRYYLQRPEEMSGSIFDGTSFKRT